MDTTFYTAEILTDGYVTYADQPISFRFTGLELEGTDGGVMTIVLRDADPVEQPVLRMVGNDDFEYALVELEKNDPSQEGTSTTVLTFDWDPAGDFEDTYEFEIWNEATSNTHYRAELVSVTMEANPPVEPDNPGVTQTEPAYGGWWGGDGDDTLTGQDTDDQMTGGAGDDVIAGGDGDDTLSGHDGDDVMQGGAGDDKLYGNDGDDTLSAGNGDDIVEGGGGDDQIEGGCGDDDMQGEHGDDVLYGNAGEDILAGNAGDDELYGGAGNDTLTAHGGDDVVMGGTDDGTVTYEGEIEPPFVSEDVTVKLVGVGAGRTVTVESTDPGFESGRTFAGEILVEIDGVKHLAFCTEINEPIGFSTYEYITAQLTEVPDSAGGMSPEQADLIKQLYEIIELDLEDRGLSNDGAQDLLVVSKPGNQDLLTLPGDKTLTADQATAIQILIWEIVHDYEPGGEIPSLDEGALTFTNVRNGAKELFEEYRSKLEYPKAPDACADDDYELTGHEGDSTLAEGDLVGVEVGDELYGDGGADTFIYRAGDGVDRIWDFKADEGDEIHVYGFDGVERVEMVQFDGDQHESTMLVFGDDQAIVFNDSPMAPSEADGFDGVRFFDDAGDEIGPAAEPNGAPVVDPAPMVDPAPTADLPDDDPQAPATIDADHVYTPGGDETIVGGQKGDLVLGGTVDRWWDGFTAQLSLTNTGEEAIDDWEVMLDVGHDLSAHWNVTVVDEEGGIVTLDDAGWNQSIGAGETVYFGFNGVGDFDGDIMLL